MKLKNPEKHQLLNSTQVNILAPSVDQLVMQLKVQIVQTHWIFCRNTDLTYLNFRKNPIFVEMFEIPA